MEPLWRRVRLSRNSSESRAAPQTNVNENNVTNQDSQEANEWIALSTTETEVCAITGKVCAITGNTGYYTTVTGSKEGNDFQEERNDSGLDIGFACQYTLGGADGIENLKAGKCPFYEPGMDALLSKHLNKTKLLNFSSSLEDSIQNTDIIFITV